MGSIGLDTQHRGNITYRPKTTFLVTAIACICTTGSFAAEREFQINKKYLNLPVENEAPECLMTLEVDGEKMRVFFINLAPGEPEYWVYLEVKEFVGKKGKLIASEISSSQMKGFESVFQADTFPGEDELYKEKLRPQFHFSSKRGWRTPPCIQRLEEATLPGGIRHQAYLALAKFYGRG